MEARRGRRGNKRERSFPLVDLSAFKTTQIHQGAGPSFHLPALIPPLAFSRPDPSSPSMCFVVVRTSQHPKTLTDCPALVAVRYEDGSGGQMKRERA